MVADMREEHRLRVFENRMQRGLRGTRCQGSGEDYITRSFMICTAHEKLSG